MYPGPFYASVGERSLNKPLGRTNYKNIEIGHLVHERQITADLVQHAAGHVDAARAADTRFNRGE